MRKIINIILVANLFFLCSCANFLKENSQNLAYVENIEDLEEILLGEGYFIPTGAEMPYEAGERYWGDPFNQVRNYFARIHVMDDDAEEFANGQTNTATAKYSREAFRSAYTWQDNPFYDIELVEKKDEEWTIIYKRIAVLNSIIFQVEELRDKEQDQDRLTRVKGEALFLRAQYYFWLTNLYGQPYSKATAATDLGVPLKTTEVIVDMYYSRAPLKDIYDQIITDLTESAECLKGVKQKKPIRVGEYAPYALLSRVYLYMEEYEKAIEMADVVISSKYRVLNHNELAVNASAVYQESSETIFTQGYNCMEALHPIEVAMIGDNVGKFFSAGYTSSQELMECYEPDDLRLRNYFVERTATKGSFRCIKRRSANDGVVSDRFLIRVPEVILNKAEAEAILGRASAKETLQQLRVNRFAPGKLTDINLNGEELVRYIRDERRRELCYEGHRWFDLRRYAVNSKYPFTKKIVHGIISYDGTNGIFFNDGEFELEEYSKDIAAYIIPVPREVIEFNKGAIENIQRKDRQKRTK